MKKIIISFSIIAAVAAIAVYATTAYFTDSETSAGNTFSAGAIDLTIDSTQHFNNAVCVNGLWALEPPATSPLPDQYPVIGTACGGTWALKDLIPTADKFFNFEDIKPGDSGENTISLHVNNNNAWGCVNIIPTKNDDVSSTEPELEAGDTPNTDSIFDGELAQNMQFRIWADICDREYIDQEEEQTAATPGDNIYQEGCDRLLTEGSGPITPTTYALADSQHPNVFTGVANSPLNGAQNYYLGAGWSLPSAVGNIVQTDNYQADISFNVVQSRNNASFVCPSVAQTNPNSLRLENETPVVGGPWTVINDGIYAVLTWAGDGPTFNYTLNAQGLTPSTSYSLIYYADGWPGNNPGAFIGAHITDGTGKIVGGVGNPNLGINLPTLPDGNFAVGAKIWLVLSSDYNSGSLSTGPMTAWNPSQYLFEGNVYIHYDDTND